MVVETPSLEHAKLFQAFEHLIRSSSGNIERTEVCRAIRSAMISSPGDVHSHWSSWVVDAGRSLGLRLDPFSGSTKQAVDLADCGATLLTWCDSSERFLIINRNDRGQVQSLWCDSALLSPGPAPRRLAEVVSQGDSNLVVKWSVVSPAGAQQHGGSHEHHLSPLTRLCRMLKLELSDLGVLLILGVVVGLLATAVPIAGQQLVRAVTFGTLYQPIVVLSLMLLLFLGFMGGLQALNVFVVELIQQRLFARTVADLSLHLPRVDYQSLRQANGPELLNRFLEIVTVQKVVAGLLVDGLAVALTTTIGMILLSFYHPFLLGYNVLLLGLLTFVIFVLGIGGTRTAIQESMQKYRVAAWLQEMARCPLAFRLAGGADFAIARADRLCAEYLTARQSHFRVLLRQILCLFAIQALASTTLLGLGGYLVIQEQLTLGQLVAAELIVTMIVGSFAKLSKHIEGYFDLMAAMNKLGHLFDLPLEQTGSAAGELEQSPLVGISSRQFLPILTAEGINRSALEQMTEWPLERGHHLAIFGGSGSGKSRLADMLFGLQRSEPGEFRLRGHDLRELTPQSIRHNVALIREIEVLAATVEENIHLGRTDVHRTAVSESLSLVGLDQEIASYPEGVRTELKCDGWPLSGSQQVRLMIARAAAGSPRLLLIDGLLDRLPDDLLHPLVKKLIDARHPWTLVVLTGRQEVAQLFPNCLKLHPKSNGGEHLTSPSSPGHLT